VVLPLNFRRKLEQFLCGPRHRPFIMSDSMENGSELSSRLSYYMLQAAHTPVKPRPAHLKNVALAFGGFASPANTESDEKAAEFVRVAAPAPAFKKEKQVKQTKAAVDAAPAPVPVDDGALKAAVGEKESLAGQVAQLKKELADARAVHAASNSASAKSVEKVAALEAQVSKLSSDLAAAVAKADSLAKDVAAAMQKQRDEALANAESLRGKLKSTEDRLASLEASNRRELAAKESELAKSRQSTQTAIEEVAALKEKVTSLQDVAKAQDGKLAATLEAAEKAASGALRARICLRFF
jgi:septal ring factor EnvC (AmiA/AmiB activator)